MRFPITIAVAWRGALLMLWASHMKNELGRNGYVQTLARSTSGELPRG